MNEYLIFALHWVFAVTFFYILNWIGRHSVSLGYIQLSIFVRDDEAPAFNFILRTFSPVIYIILLSTLFYSLEYDSIVKNIWLIVLYYFIFRATYNLVMGRMELINWKTQFTQWIISIPLSYFIYTKIITQKVNLMPDVNTIGNELWLIIIIYLYIVMNNIKTSDEGTRRRKISYIKNKYYKYRKLYSKIIEKHAKNKKIENIIYALLIYENFARPKAFRFFESLVPEGYEITRGVMQIKTNKRISDVESIILATKKIKNDYTKSLRIVKKEAKEVQYYRNPSEEILQRRALRETVASYNRDDDYIEEVMELFESLLSLHSGKE